MAEELEGRVRTVEQSLAVIRQRVEDHETDIRAFAPLVVAEAELRTALAAIHEDLREGREAARRLEARLEKEAKARQDGQAERKKETASNRTLLRVAAIGLAGTFLTSTGGIIAALLIGHP